MLSIQTYAHNHLKFYMQLLISCGWQSMLEQDACFHGELLNVYDYAYKINAL